ncbi:MAG: hypothetical protein AABY22_10830 [Nanoarchaeota archaeon]
MLNPDIKIAKSKGIDLPIMYVYLAGRIAGNCMDKCTEWRKQIRSHYENYKTEKNICNICLGFGGTESINSVLGNQNYKCIHCNETGFIERIVSYPISFIDPLNSGESKTADALGLKSHLSSNLIYDKDLFSVRRADVIVANVEDYFEEGIEKYLIPNDPRAFDEAISEPPNFDYIKAYNILKEKILNHRENFGTICEIAWALYLQKPLILIVPIDRKYIYENHPFAKRASVIVTSVDQLLKEKWLNTLYKAISGATY